MIKDKIKPIYIVHASGIKGIEKKAIINGVKEVLDVVNFRAYS